MKSITYERICFKFYFKVKQVNCNIVYFFLGYFTIHGHNEIVWFQNHKISIWWIVGDWQVVECRKIKRVICSTI